MSTATIEQPAAEAASATADSLDPCDSSAVGGRAAHVVLVLLLLGCALVRFWRAPVDAGGRLTTPDGAEYALAAHRLAAHGTLDIELAGARFPSRYPPLFSAMLAPVYFVAPGEIGNAIVVVLGFAMLMVGAACVLGWRIAGTWGAATASMAVIFHPLIAEFARTIMSDLPVAALAVVGLAVFLRLKRPAEHHSQGWTWLLAGLIVAIAAGLRPLAGFFLLPFLALLVLSGRRGVVVRFAALLGPMLLLGVVTGIYNHDRFGAWWRTGYHFWCPIPYEFPHLTWSWRFLEDNARLFARPILGLTVIGGLAGITSLFVRKHATGPGVAAFFVLAALPISVAHLYYFHVETRFHLALVALCCVAGAAGLILWLPRCVRSRPWGAVVLAAMGLALARPPQDVHGSYRESAQYLATYVPPGATLVTGADPVQLDPLVLRPARRQWVPVWRRQNYAGHAIAPQPIQLPETEVLWPGTHRAPALMTAGAREAVAWTATERPDLLAKRMAGGPGVFFDAASLAFGSEPYKRMHRLYVMQPIDPQGRIMRLLSVRPSEEADKPEAAE
ncbi:MAG TPA: hypothetical protein VGR35_07460 [Tepidisphaeraceae bacterium]|nr:hypothetical protein [Tepidisphaeraceae bacterium]